jgi:hypothetical protein
MKTLPPHLVRVFHVLEKGAEVSLAAIASRSQTSPYSISQRTRELRNYGYQVTCRIKMKGKQRISYYRLEQ